MLKLYEYPASGNSYKPRLLMHLLDIKHDVIALDILKGETRTPEFLKTKSPNGRIPVLQLDDGRTLWESHAILWYLAEGSSLIPKDPWARAKALQWMCFEQYNLEPNVAVARFWIHTKKNAEVEMAERFKEWHQKGYEALAILENALNESDFLTGEFSIADIALYGYTHVADEGGFDMVPYPNIAAWIVRIEAMDNFIPMESGYHWTD
jgi:glutathione S-transferase